MKVQVEMNEYRLEDPVEASKMMLEFNPLISDWLEIDWSHNCKMYLELTKI